MNSEIQTEVQPAIFNSVDREAKKAGLILFGKHDAHGDHFRFAYTMTEYASEWIPKKTYALAWVAGFLAAQSRRVEMGERALAKCRAR